MMQDPAYALEFTTDTLLAARSGELAYETGRYSLTLSGPEGEPGTTLGGYIVVWRKGTDGVWRYAVDAPISDPPLEEPLG
jgi:ketosteroid isomerase-like protein